MFLFFNKEAQCACKNKFKTFPKLYYQLSKKINIPVRDERATNSFVCISGIINTKLFPNYKCDLFVNMMSEYGLSQHNKEISGPASNNISNLILTNNPSSVSHEYCTPGMSNHNAVICVLNILYQYTRKPKRTIFMHNKANWDDILTETK